MCERARMDNCHSSSTKQRRLLLCLRKLNSTLSTPRFSSKSAPKKCELTCIVPAALLTFRLVGYSTHIPSPTRISKNYRTHPTRTGKRVRRIRLKTCLLLQSQSKAQKMTRLSPQQYKRTCLKWIRRTCLRALQRRSDWIGGAKRVSRDTHAQRLSLSCFYTRSRTIDHSRKFGMIQCLLQTAF